MPKTRQVMLACEMCSELADLVWRKSLIEKGTLTPPIPEEAKRVVIAYLDAVLADLARALYHCNPSDVTAPKAASMVQKVT